MIPSVLPTVVVPIVVMLLQCICLRVRSVGKGISAKEVPVFHVK